MPELQYLFDSSGNWTAFRRGRFVFSPTGEWLGWVPDRGCDVMDTDGQYLGTIHSDRLYRDHTRREAVDPYHPGYPGREQPPSHPGYPGRSDLPDGMADVSLLEHA